jgi:anti-sigma B factor antagonist
MSSSYAPGVVTVDRVGSSSWMVTLQGEHDLTNSDRLRAELTAIFAYGTTVIVDLSAATFVDSSIVQELVAAQERIADVPTEQLAIVAPKDGFPRRVLDLLQTDGVLRIVETRDDALRSFDAGSHGAESRGARRLRREPDADD